MRCFQHGSLKKKDNHYVPQAYLRQWLINGKILTYRLLVPHKNCELWKPHSPKSIAKHQHLYTYFSGSKDSDEIERWLDRDFERPAIESIAKVVGESRMTSEDWNNLFRFAVAQSVRTPVDFQRFIRRQDETLSRKRSLVYQPIDGLSCGLHLELLGPPPIIPSRG